MHTEAQIHGDVRFDRDVDALVVHARHAKDGPLCAKLNQFCDKNHISLIFMEEDNHAGGGGAGGGMAAPVVGGHAAVSRRGSYRVHVKNRL
jgi:hypothetical protein